MKKLIIVLVLSLNTSFSFASNYFYIDNKDFTPLFYAKLKDSLDGLDDFASKLSIVLKQKKEKGQDRFFYFESLPKFNQIKINGNHYFDSDRIKYAISTMGLKKGLESVSLQYKTNGFNNLKIKTHKTKDFIYLDIVEGEQTKLCSIKFIRDKEDIGVKKGENTSPGDILERLSRLNKKLIKNGYFESSVNFDLNTKKQCLYLVLDVKKGPKYNIKYKSGLVRPKELKDLIKSLDDPLNYRILNSKIASLCEEKGLFCVSSFQKYYKEALEVDLEVNVEEQQYPYVKTINIKSKNKVLQKEIEDFVFYKNKFYIESKFLNALDEFKLELEDKGYRVNSLSHKVNIQKNNANIDVFVNAKLPSKIIKVSSVCDFINLSSLKNQSFSKEKLNNFCDNLSQNTKQKGYLYAECTYKLRDLGDSLELKVCYKKNIRFKVGKIYIMGQNRTKKSSIENEILFKENSYINKELIVETRDNLNIFPAFSSVQLEILNYSKLGKEYKDVLLVVNERAPRLINYGASYDTDTGLSLSTEFYHRNIFGSLFQFGVGGLLRTQFGSSFRFLEYEVFSSLRKRNYSIKTSFSDFDYKAYGKRSFKLIFTWQRDNSFNNHFYIQNTLEFAKLHDVISPVDSDVIDLSIRPTYVYNNVDNVFSPTKGIKIYSYFDLNYSFANIDSLSIKGFANLRTYYPLYKQDYILVNYFSIGSVYALKNSVPLDKRFHLGGATNLRGYDFNTIQDIGNTVSKQLLYTGTFEFRKKMFWEIWAIGFFDIGNLASDNLAYSPLYSTGGGLRLNTLVGAITFVYGYVLDPKNRIPTSAYGKLHIALITF